MHATAMMCRFADH